MFGSMGAASSGGGGGFTADLLAFNRYRNQLDAWKAIGVAESPIVYEDFMAGTYYSADMVVTADFLAFLAASGGSVTRASAGTLHNSAGDLVEFAANVPRITDRGMRVEGNGTNLISNPRCEGAVAGTPGTLPTSMSGPTTSNGISRQVVGSGTSNGIPYVDVRYAGTSVSSGKTILLSLAPTSYITAAYGDTFTTTLYTKVVGGSIANLTYLRFELFGSNADGSTTESPTGTNIVDGGTTKATVTHTIPSLSYVVPRLAISTGAGVAVDFTIRIGAPQCEKSAYATSVILPPVGSPAQATRAADRVVATRTSPTAISKFIRARTPAWGGVTQVVWQLDDDSNNNRLYVYRSSAGNLGVYSVVGGSVSVGLNLGALADDTEFKLALRATTNDFAASLNGAAVVTSTSGAMPTGIVNERIGHSTNGSEWYGLIRENDRWTELLSDAKLQALSA